MRSSKAPTRTEPGTAVIDVLALDRQLCFALYATSHAMTRAYQPLLAPLGLTYPQYLALLVLWQQDGLTVSQLGDRLALESGTLTPLLKRLETAGFVQRLRDTADERRVRLCLTAAGRDLRTQAAAIPRTLAAATGCEPGEILSLVQRLAALRARLSTTSPTP